MLSEEDVIQAAGTEQPDYPSRTTPQESHSGLQSLELATASKDLPAVCPVNIKDRSRKLLKKALDVRLARFK